MNLLKVTTKKGRVNVCLLCDWG